jgi:hypothetical protein
MERGAAQEIIKNLSNIKLYEDPFICTQTDGQVNVGVKLLKNNS